MYFAEVFLGVKLNPAQQRWFRLLKTNPDGWSWLYRRVVHVAANQIGKTLGLAIGILWATAYKIGIENTNWDLWLNSPYNWYHIAPTYTQSLHVMRDMRELMNGTHPAQIDRETGQRRPVYWQRGMWTEKKFDNTYPGFTLFNGANVHFRTSDERAKSLQGVRAHGVSIDEAAFENYLKEVLDQAVKLRLISTGGPVWMVSTPDGINDYFEIVNEILNSGAQTFHPRVWEAPDKRIALVWSHISDNVGYGLTQEDVDFMEADVDPATKEQQLRGAFLEPLDAFFVPSAQIAGAFTRKLVAEEDPKNDHHYIIFWDPSVASDPTVVVVLDVTRKPWRGVYFRRWAKPMPVRELLSEMARVHNYWNSIDPTHAGARPRAITGFDASSMGGVMLKQELASMTPQRPLNMTGSERVKLELLSTLRAVLSKRELYIPAAWLEAKREVLSYRRDDKHIKQDIVMALCGAVKVAAESYLGDHPSVKMSFGRTTQIGQGLWH